MTTVVDAEVQLTVVSDAAGRMRVQATGFQFDADGPLRSRTPSARWPVCRPCMPIRGRHPL